MSNSPAPFESVPASSSQPKYQAIRDELTNAIRTNVYAPGSRLPTERQLSEQFGVTRMTVRQAITGLVRAGLVVNRRPQGNFVRDSLPQKRSERHINLICVGTESSHAETFIEHGIAAAADRDIHVRVLRIYPGSEHMAGEAIRGADPSILIGGIGDGRNELHRIIRDAAERVVLIGMRMDHAGVHCIVGDDELGLGMAVDHLHQAGHERIGLIGSVIANEHPTMELQIQHWRNAMIAQGLSRGTMDKHIIRLKPVTAGGVAMAARNAVIDYFDRQRVRATAFIALSEEAAFGSLAGLNECGCSVPDDVSVIAYAGSCRSQLTVPALTAVDIDVDQHLSAATDLVDAMLRGREDDTPDKPASPDNNPRRLTVIPPTLIERASVAGRKP